MEKKVIIMSPFKIEVINSLRVRLDLLKKKEDGSVVCFIENHVFDISLVNRQIKRVNSKTKEDMFKFFIGDLEQELIEMVIDEIDSNVHITQVTPEAWAVGSDSDWSALFVLGKPEDYQDSFTYNSDVVH